jgi:hypothetical protein
MLLWGLMPCVMLLLRLQLLLLLLALLLLLPKTVQSRSFRLPSCKHTACHAAVTAAAAATGESRPEPQLPIAFLRAHSVSVRARSTSAAAAPVNISFAFTDPELDWDVSKHVQQDGLLEIGISQVRLLFNDRSSF